MTRWSGVEADSGGRGIYRDPHTGQRFVGAYIIAVRKQGPR